MNRITRRVWIVFLFIGILLGGTCFFAAEYALKSDEWVVFSGSPHVYNNNNIGCGVVTDRDGVMLLDTTDKRTYSSDAMIRQSTLHWLGDRKGNIQAQAIATYAEELSGFDPVNGVYSYGGTGGQAYLSLSARAQTTALAAMGGRKGTVAVYNYKTGEILCAVTTPTFDPDYVPNIEGDTTGAYEGIYLNRFLQSTYIPGSIFKTVTTAAALECVEDIESMTFQCNGIYEFGVDRVTCERAHGTRDLRGALASSCNCCFAQIAQLIGRDNMMAYAEKFGISDSITFDGLSTAKGNFNVSEAAPVELAWGCIGQYTDQINPCRFMTFMGAVAGGGEAAVPHLVSRIEIGSNVTYRAKTETTGRLMPRETAETLQEYMRNNVVTVYGADYFPGLTVCGKSGTSQLGGGQTSNAMFAGFSLDEAYPFAFIAVVENGGYGSATCIPILSQVLAACKAAVDAG